MSDVEEYAREAGEDIPLGAYAGMMLAFIAGFGGFLLQRGRRKRLPDNLSTRDIVLLGVATHKLTQMLTRDRVTAAVRFPFTRFQGTSGAGHVDERARGHGLRRAMGTLLTCPFCVGPWTAAPFTAALIARPRETRLVASMLAIVTISDFIHQAYASARRPSRASRE